MCRRRARTGEQQLDRVVAIEPPGDQPLLEVALAWQDVSEHVGGGHPPGVKRGDQCQDRIGRDRRKTGVQAIVGDQAGDLVLIDDAGRRVREIQTVVSS